MYLHVVAMSVTEYAGATPVQMRFDLIEAWWLLATPPPPQPATPTVIQMDGWWIQNRYDCTYAKWPR